MGRTGVLAVGMAMALADTSIVTLALPQLERDLRTSVTGVAAVLFVYATVLAVALALVGRAAGGRTAGRWALGGFSLIAVGSLVCGAAGSLDVLLAGRVLQAGGAAAALAGGFALIDGAGRGRRAWTAASILGIAVGPALGGALTQLLDWRAIFIFQVPVAAAGTLAALGRSSALSVRADERPEAQPGSATARVALALVSAALSAVLFLVVLLVVAGWDVSPLSAAAAVTPLPVAAALAVRIRGPARMRAVVGCALIGAGVLALAWIPQAYLAWIVPPEIIAGIGMGCALSALSGELVPERTPREAAALLSIRHAGVAVVLVVLASIIASELVAATHTAELQGVALLLDSPLPAQSKLALVPQLMNVAAAPNPRAALRDGLAGQGHRFTGAERARFDRLAANADATVLAAVERSFHLAFVVSGALAFLAGALLLLVGPGLRRPGQAARAGPESRDRGRRRFLTPAKLAIAALCLLTPVAYAALEHRLAPATVAIGNPCSRVPSPQPGGTGGVLQTGALSLLDTTACHLHSTREELVLALVDPAEGARFAARHHGFALGSLIQRIAGLLPGS